MANHLITKCTPAVPRHWLAILAGLVWSVVGLGLCVTAAIWLSDLPWQLGAIGFACGLGFGYLIYRFGLSKIATRNVTRIARQPERVCLFAFQAWKSYILILLMIILGYTLRHSHVSHSILAVVYAGMGSGLAFSSCIFYSKQV